jgi:hypothetical protein
MKTRILTSVLALALLFSACSEGGGNTTPSSLVAGGDNTPAPEPAPADVTQPEPTPEEINNTGNDQDNGFGENDDFQYEINNGEVTIMHYKGSDVAVEIPSQIEGKSVTSIGEIAFSGCTALTNIMIPDSVTSIGEYAFFDCWGLTDITIPNGVKSIGGVAFSGCMGLTNITIPDGVKSIGDDAFYNCMGLTDITIPSGITSIGDRTFYGCTGLTTVTIPDGVTSIGKYAFSGCTALTNIMIPDSVTSIGSGDYAAIKKGWAVTAWSGAFGGCTSLEKAVYKGENYSVNFVGQWTNGREQYDLPEEFYNAINGT